MSKKLINIHGVLFFSLIFFSFPIFCLADVVAPDLGTGVLGISIVFGINFLINALLLVIGYFILRKINLIKSWKFLLYICFVTIGGFLIDALLLYLVFPSLGDLFLKELSGIFLASFVFLGSLSLFFYNYLLARKMFNLARGQAFLIGLIIGIFTNPFLFTSFGI